MLSLAVIVAAIATALGGAPSAMAESSLLCTKDAALNPTAEECEEPYEVHLISVNEKGELAHAALLTEFLGSPLTIECNLLIQGTVLTGLINSGPVKIHVAAEDLVYSNCLNCTLKVEEGGVIEVLKEGPELSKVTGTGFRVKTVCFGMKCVYNATGLVGHGLGPLEAGTNSLGHVTYTNTTVRSLSGVCPETAKLDALFKSLTPLYVRGAPAAMAKQGTLLCTKDSQLNPETKAECNEPSEVHLISVNEKGELAHAALLTEFLGSPLTIECNVLIQGTVLTGSVAGAPVKIHVAAEGLVYSNCLNCTVKVEKGGVLEVLKEGPELSKVTGAGFRVKVTCFGIECTYNPVGPTGHGLGPLEVGTNSLGHVTYLNTTVSKISGVCPETAKLDALFKSLTPLYVRGTPPAMDGSSLLCNLDSKLVPTAAECNEPSEVHFISVNKEGELGHATLLGEFLGAPITIECNVLIQGTVLTGLVSNGPVKVHVAVQGLVYSNCLNKVCTITVEEGGVIEVLQEEGVELSGVTGTGFKVKLACPTLGIKCVYRAAGLVGHGLGPLEVGTNNVGHVTYTNAAVSKSGICPAEAKLDALFKSLTPLYVRG